jgi:hypothetical protein
MQASGVHLARSSLTGLMHRVGQLLEPIAAAQWESILVSDWLALDETPIKAGVQSRGKMKTGSFWPIHGDRDEVVFPYAPTRAASVVRELLHGSGSSMPTRRG